MVRLLLATGENAAIPKDRSKPPKTGGFRLTGATNGFGRPFVDFQISTACGLLPDSAPAGVCQRFR